MNRNQLHPGFETRLASSFLIYNGYIIRQWSGRPGFNPRSNHNVTFRPLVKQTTTRNLYITIYIYFLDGRLFEVGAVRRGIRIVRRWGLNFRCQETDGPRQRTQRDDERGFVNSGILFSLSSSVQFVSLILPSISHAEIKTRLYASAIFPISGDWDALLPLIWNGQCDRRRAEITVMQFTGHSLPVHHWSGTFTLSHIISRAHLRDFFRLLAIGMCHFLPVYHLGIAFLGWVEGQNITITKIRKRYLIPHCLTLSTKMYGSRISESNSGKGVAPPPQHFSVVSIENGAFGSLSTTVG